MSYKTEFPDYDGELYIPDGFIDTSWHNDIMPHVSMIRQTADGNEIVYNIWQDYVNKNLREYENTKRYAFAIVVNEEYWEAPPRRF